MRRAGVWLARRATSRFRLEPSFFVIGASKAGTTTLYDAIARHPRVGRASSKEVQYFDFHFEDRSDGWYRAHFPLHRGGLITGEATPYYLADPRAPARLASRYPHGRLIAIVREPVARAYSQWAHETELGAETLPFPAAVAHENERLAGELDRMLAEPAYTSWNHFKFSYVARGLYLEQLERWLAHFPREQLLVLRLEDFAERPAGVLAETFRFLGLPPAAGVELPRLNVRSYPPLDDETRRRLQERFAEPNRRLEAFLGRTLDWGYN